MRIRALSLTLLTAILYTGDAMLPLLAKPHSCSCPMKAPCCTGKVCPMKHEASMRTCEKHTIPVALIVFLRPALLPVAEGVAVFAAGSIAYAERSLIAQKRFISAPDHPPRALLLAA